MTTNRNTRRAGLLVAFVIALAACDSPPDQVSTVSNEVRGDLEALCPPCSEPHGRPPLGDFNKDGMSDILWRHALTGEMRVWLMDPNDGTTCEEERLVSNPGPFPDPGWKVKGTGDFDGDPARDADILWQNDISHRVVIWIMDGTSHVDGDYIDCGSDSASWPDWKIAGTGDFNADKKADILWQRVAGTKDLEVWYMDGVKCTGRERLAPGPAGNWTAYGGGFFDDGTYGVKAGTDILWRNSDSGRSVIWYMDGFIHGAGSFVVPDEAPGISEIVGIGRYDDDDHCSDILRRSSSNGGLVVWQMTGHTASSIVPVPGCGGVVDPTDPNWVVVGPH